MMRQWIVATLSVGLMAFPAGAQQSVLPKAKPQAARAGSQEPTAAAIALTSVSKLPPIKQAPPKRSAKRAAPIKARYDVPAKSLFGKARQPAPLAARSIGSYARGCLAGAAPMEIDGPTWQVMRLSRNRNWGHPELITYLKKLAADAPSLGWNGLLVGDLAQPRGGPMLTGHSSHQVGLDADIWLTQMPNRRLSRREREEISAVSMLKENMEIAGADRSVHPKKWTRSHARLIRRAAKDPRVARIFVSPAIKKALCEFAGRDRGWLRTVRPWWGHHYHFHVRLKCPRGDSGCKNQAAPPAGDGCGKELTYWLSDEPWVPKKPKKGEKPKKPAKKKQITLAGLPNACKTVLVAQ